MAASKQTRKSELLFQRYCEKNGYACNRITESKIPKTRRPDFDVMANGHKIAVEVKEIVASDEDLRVCREFRTHGFANSSREPGKRARKCIEDAVGQLRPFAKEKYPTVVVLYDNILVDGSRPQPGFDPFGPVAPYDIDIGLFGLHSVNLRLHADGHRESLGDGRSRRRKVHDLECISAVSVLIECPDEDNIALVTFHNFLASIQLPGGVFCGPLDRHCIKPKHPDLCPGEWKPLPY